jgi:hypothetical protein
VEHVVPEHLAAALRAAGLTAAGPLDTRDGRPRWTALDPDGRRWAVGVVGPERADEARRRAALLAGLEHPHLAVAGPVLEAADGGVLALVAAEPGVDLAVLLGARGPLDDAEAVGALAPVAGALAALHAGGLAHGDLTAADVVLTDSGPVLADVGGGASPVGAPAPVLERRQAEDVADLAAIGRRLIGVGATGPVAAACAHGTARSASDLQARLRAAATPRPVDLPDPAVLARLALLRLAVRPAGRHRESGPEMTRRDRRRRWPRWHARPRWSVRPPRRRRLLVGLGLVVVAVTVAVAVVDLARPSETRAAKEAAVRLTEQRVAALAAGAPERLVDLTEPGSPAAAADAGLVAAPVQLDSVSVQAGDPVTDGCPADLVCVPVRTQTTVAGEDVSTSVTLGLRPGSWRVVQVSPAP